MHFLSAFFISSRVFRSSMRKPRNFIDTWLLIAIKNRLMLAVLDCVECDGCTVVGYKFIHRAEDTPNLSTKVNIIDRMT